MLKINNKITITKLTKKNCAMTSSVLGYNPGQDIWNKTEKSSKTGQDKKSLISTFACFLTAAAKV